MSFFEFFCQCVAPSLVERLVSVGSILSIGSVGSILGIFQYHSWPNNPQ